MKKLQAIMCLSGTLLTGCSSGVTYDQVVDSRDNNQYLTVRISNQLWMAENLKYDGIDHYSVYNDNKNDEKYGYLYTWENAMKACPTGWRLPTKEEFESLITLYGASEDTISLRDQTWKDGLNYSGFGALPAGGCWFGQRYDMFGVYALFWSSTPSGNSDAYRLDLCVSYAYVTDYDRGDAFSVRCVKDLK